MITRELYRLNPIFRAIESAGGRALVVGGFARDMHLGTTPKDVDIEVYGLVPADLVRVLSDFGQVDLVGQSFGVYKVHGLDLDFSLPRTDSKVGDGHKGFEVEVDPWLDPQDAAYRRDFTMNSIAFDPLTGEWLDFFGGFRDLDQRTLRMTSHETFADDPLRVLRGFQFTARFNLHPEFDTIRMCKVIKGQYAHLSKERIWGEWWKWATKSVRPSRGLWFLRDTEWVGHFPALSDLIGEPQDPEWHPEGDVWEHTCQAVDIAADVAAFNDLGPEDTAVLVFAALLHDTGKPMTTQKNAEGRWASPGHPEVGSAIARDFLQSIGAPVWLIDRVVPLVREHLAHLNGASNRAVRRLANRLAPATIWEWFCLVEVDTRSRDNYYAATHPQAWAVLTTARWLEVANQGPAPLLMGRHLLDLGWTPGPHMGDALRQAFEAQLDDEFDTLDGAVAWAQLHLTNSLT